MFLLAFHYRRTVVVPRKEGSSMQPAELGNLLLAPTATPDSAVGHAIIGRDLCWIEADQRFAALFRLPTVLAGRAVAETLPTLEQALLPMLQRVLATGESFSDIEVAASDVLRWMISFYPVRSRTGLVLAIDSTARELPQKRNRASESRIPQAHGISDALFRRLADVSQTGVLIGERNGRVDYMNTALLNLLGYSQADLDVGLNWRSLLLPADADRDAEALATLAGSGISAPYEKEYLTRDGRRVPVRISAVLLESQPISERRAAVFVNDLSTGHQAQALVDTLVQKAPIGLAFVDREFRYQQVNEALAKLNGRSIEAHLGRSVRELFPHVAAQWIECWQQILATGEPVIDLELSYTPPDGAPLYALVSYYPVRANDESILGIGIVVLDITERRRAEQERQELLEREREARARAEQSQALLDGLLANAPVGISFFDTDLRYLMISESLAALNLYPPAAHLGHTVEEMAGYAAPMVIPVMQSVLERGIAQVIEVSHTTPAQPNQIGHWLLTLYPLRRADGSAIGVGGVRVSITDRKRVEERQRYLVEVSRLLADSFDYHTTLNQVAQFMVPHFADWFVIELLNEQQTLDIITIAHTSPDLVAQAREARTRWPIDMASNQSVVRVLRTGTAVHWPEVSDALLAEAARDDEELALMRGMAMQSTMLVPLVTRGQIVGVMSFVSTNPTRRYIHADLVLAEEIARRCAQAIDNARLFQAARDAVAVRDAFLSTAAHELRTPLTTLLGQAQLAQRRLEQHPAVSERERRPVQIVVDQASRLRRMIGEMLDLSRLESGQFSLSNDLVDLADLVMRVVESVQPVFASHQLRTNIIARSQIIGDAMRLEQVLQNLLSNAVKYSPNASVIDIRLDRHGEMARIAIRDYGIGIAADAIPQLFQRFYRAPNTEQQGISGIGVGLYVVQEIIALHHGTVSVESVEGQGSTFTLMLPVV